MFKLYALVILTFVTLLSYQQYPVPTAIAIVISGLYFIDKFINSKREAPEQAKKWVNEYLTTKVDFPSKDILIPPEINHQILFSELVNRFANHLIVSEGGWPPAQINIQDNELNEFMSLLPSELLVDKETVLSALTRTLYNRYTNIFRDVFLEHSTLPGTEDEAARLYVELFMSDDRYLTYMNEILNKEWGIRTSIDKLQSKVNEVRKLPGIERLASALLSGQAKQRNRIQIEDIDVMDGINFEKFLATLFRDMGYKVEMTKATGDQGADLIVERLGVRSVVQAKRYTGAVGNKAIQEAVSAKAFYGCTNAMVVTNSSFTFSAYELAQANEVALWDREKLIETINAFLRSA